MAGTSAYRIVLVLAAAAALLACAPKQRIALDCVPEEVVVYVDGERLDEMPSELDLRSDEPHTLYFKGPGIAPELIVLESGEVSGKRRLTPENVCVKPRYLRVRRELELQIDPDVAAEPPPGAAENRSAIDVEPRPEFVPESP